MEQPPDFTEREPFRNVATWLSTLIPRDAWFEIRILRFQRADGGRENLYRRFQNSKRGMIESVRYALRFGAMADATYFTMNPVDVHSKLPSKDSDVVWRNWLLVDFDPVREGHTSATDAEKEIARKQARQVYRALKDREWPDPVACDSGNGFHLLYRISLPNTVVERDLVRDALTALSCQFDGHGSAIDRSNFNAGRLTKVYGTMAKKGPHSSLRPWRTSKVIYMPKWINIVPRSFLEALVKDWGRPSSEPSRGEVERMVREENRGIIDIPAFYRASKYLAAFPPAISGQHGHNVTFRAACCAGPGFGISEEQLLRLMMDIYNPRCVPEWSERELKHKVSEAFKRESRPRGWKLTEERRKT